MEPRKEWFVGGILRGVAVVVLAVTSAACADDHSKEPGEAAVKTTLPAPEATEAPEISEADVAAGEPPHTTTKERSTWTVTSVVDGDTIDVEHADGAAERVRIIGIDAPEAGECGYREASDALAAMVLGGGVTLTAGARDDRDRYARLLRYVDIDGVDAGLAVIEQGLAVARYDSRDGYGAHPREDIYVATDAATPAVTCPGSGGGPGTGPGGVWRNCTDAREASAAPVYRGDPGYGPHLDRDGDGIGCE